MIYYNLWYIKTIQGKKCNTLLNGSTDINHIYRLLELNTQHDEKVGATKREYEIRIEYRE